MVLSSLASVDLSADMTTAGAVGPGSSLGNLYTCSREACGTRRGCLTCLGSMIRKWFSSSCCRVDYKSNISSEA